VIQDLNPDFRIKPVLVWSVCWIASKMWIHYLVSISHFAKCLENWPVTVYEMLINLKSHTPQ